MFQIHENQNEFQFRNGDGIDVSGNNDATVFRFAAYDVRERLTATRTLLGTAKLSVADLVASGNEGGHGCHPSFPWIAPGWRAWGLEIILAKWLKDFWLMANKPD